MPTCGFSNVIGTLWKVNDRSYVDMALKTYEYMLDQDMSGASVNKGLQHAARWLRARSIDPKALRVAYIH
jgi:CHAT domain-containing protein